jgi:hypothetical protein
MKFWWMAVGFGPSSTFSASRALAEFDGSQVSKGARLGLPAGSRFLVSLGMTKGRVVAGGIASVRWQEADSSFHSE